MHHISRSGYRPTVHRHPPGLHRTHVASIFKTNTPRHLSEPFHIFSSILPTNGLFLPLECYYVEYVKIDLLVNIACGSILRELKNLFLNLGNLADATQRPDPDSLAMFEQLFTRLMAAEIKDDLMIYLNHVPINPVKKPPHILQFSDFRFDQGLVVCHHHNLGQNRLKLYECHRVAHADYLDVQDTFAHFDAEKEQLGPEHRICKLQAFRLLFPSLQSVSLNNMLNFHSRPNGRLFIRFLAECLALTDLSILAAGFTNANFYDYLGLAACAITTVKTLTIMEWVYEFTDEINFSFLGRFSYLRELRTNVVTRSRAPKLVAMMQTDCVFQFQFCHKSLSDNYHLMQVKKTEDSKYELSLHQGKFLPLFDYQQIGQVVLNSFSETELFFHNQIAIPHWLDPTPKSE